MCLLFYAVRIRRDFLTLYQAWFYYSGAQAKMEANPGVYQEYVQKAEQMSLQNEFLDVIERGKSIVYWWSLFNND